MFQNFLGHAEESGLDNAFGLLGEATQEFGIGDTAGQLLRETELYGGDYNKTFALYAAVGALLVPEYAAELNGVAAGLWRGNEVDEVVVVGKRASLLDRSLAGFGDIAEVSINGLGGVGMAWYDFAVEDVVGGTGRFAGDFGGTVWDVLALNSRAGWSGSGGPEWAPNAERAQRRWETAVENGTALWDKLVELGNKPGEEVRADLWRGARNLWDEGGMGAYRAARGGLNVGSVLVPATGPSRVAKVTGAIDDIADAGRVAGAAENAGSRIIEGVDAGTLVRSHPIGGRSSIATVEDIAASMRTNGYAGPPIKVIEADGRMMIVDGHHRAAAATRTGTPVNIEIVGPEAFPMGSGGWQSIDEVVRASENAGPNRLNPPRRR